MGSGCVCRVLLIEMAVDEGMNGDEFLQTSHAEARVKVNVSIIELDHSNLDPELFDRLEMSNLPFDK
jgi:hypothetical protein